MSSHTDLVNRRKRLNIYKNSQQDADNITDYRCGRVLADGQQVRAQAPPATAPAPPAVETAYGAGDNTELLNNRYCTHLFKNEKKSTENLIKWRLGQLYTEESQAAAPVPAPEAVMLSAEATATTPPVPVPDAALQAAGPMPGNIDGIYNPECKFNCSDTEYGNENTKEMYEEGVRVCESAQAPSGTAHGRNVSTSDTRSIFSRGKEFWTNYNGLIKK